MAPATVGAQREPARRQWPGGLQDCSLGRFLHFYDISLLSCTFPQSDCSLLSGRLEGVFVFPKVQGAFSGAGFAVGRPPYPGPARAKQRIPCTRVFRWVPGCCKLPSLYLHLKFHSGFLPPQKTGRITPRY